MAVLAAPGAGKSTLSTGLITGRGTRVCRIRELAQTYRDIALDVSTLRARQIQTEPAGATYTLHHTMIHSVTADAYTTSLVVRGPAVKDRFLVTDRVTGRAWWQYGAATETPTDAYRKRMTPDQIHARLNALAVADIID